MLLALTLFICTKSAEEPGMADQDQRNAHDTAKFVAQSRAIGVTPHVAQNINAHRGSNIDGRTTRHVGYRISQVIRKRIEEANGWIKEVGGMAQTKLRGVKRVEWSFVLKAAAYNLIRLPRLLATG